jgi:exopolysaccharide production protein ExoZ
MTLVFFGHFEGLFRNYLPPGTIGSRIAGFLGLIGHQGVCFFLTLSGYFVYRACFEKRDGLGAFVRRRVWRIYPPYVIMLGVYVALSIAYPPESKIPSGHADAIRYLCANVLMISSRPLITVSWTIGTLVALYTIVPCFWQYVHFERWSPAFRIALIVAAAALWFAAPRPLPMLDARVGFVLAGFGIYEALRGGAVFTRGGELPGLVILTCGYVLWYAIDKGWLSLAGVNLEHSAARYIFLAPGLFYCCGYVIACRGRIAWLLERAHLPHFGRISYSYYLCHGLTLKLAVLALRGLRPEWHTPAVFWTALPIVYACTLISGWGWFRLVETPLAALSGMLAYSKDSEPLRNRPSPLPAPASH